MESERCGRESHVEKIDDDEKNHHGPENLPLRRIMANGLTINATTDHPFLPKFGRKPAAKIQVGDPIRMGGNSWQTVTEISDLPAPKVPPTVWNLELLGPEVDLDSHCGVANGIVTGDLMIQNKLKNQPQLGSNAGSKLD